MYNEIGSEDYDLKGSLLSEMEELDYGEEVPEKEMSDFITRGPVIIDDDADVGVFGVTSGLCWSARRAKGACGVVVERVGEVLRRCGC